jgi:hypothetical protein
MAMTLKEAGLSQGTLRSVASQNAKTGMMLNIGGSATSNYCFIAGYPQKF